MAVIGENLTTAALGTVVGSLLIAVSGLAHAQPPPPPPHRADGLVNVVVGGATVLDSVPGTQAAQAVTEMCAMPATAASAMVVNLETVGGTEVVCRGRPHGDVVLVQSRPGAEVSPVVPGTKGRVNSNPVKDVPAGGGRIKSSLPTSPDNLSGMN